MAAIPRDVKKAADDRSARARDESKLSAYDAGTPVRALWDRNQTPAGERRGERKAKRGRKSR